ncbi:calcium/calmodulin-dependent protein kinase [Durotheca rogersii]|uniref:calcium/calmodulin-dependent protein kinase n=1 Tax=Durotheca rogersii TaxID=419775 RepID=UPI0022203B63|nr:calcium/calmodulin-dependent protein kinase [Durotheca rogersii]KAI5868572.1 calcium/calmodulin-dependent protein kinase [Durotheca rogersii]
MPRDGPHPLTFFSLVPLNDRAIAVLEHPENAHLVSIFEDKKNNNDALHGPDIGPFIGSKSRYTLATIGRCGDVILHEGNKTEVMLQDRSSNKSTKLFGETAMGFELERAHRRVVVDKTINLVFGLGGVACDLLQFRIVWHPHDKRATDLYFDYREDNPRQTRTIPDEPPTIAPSRVLTRIHTPSLLGKIRYSTRERLGNGAFGEVWRVADVDTGNYLAVKRVKQPALLTHDYFRLKREVDTLSRISHRNIIEFIAAQWGDGYLDIVMEIKPGSVEDLIRDNLFIRERSLASPFLHQMLQALDYLENQGIVHRDVKPENILYSPAVDGGYLYQLADFGLANMVADARTFAGSRIYMAPELEQSPQSPQTPKMDIWSRFVTLVYAMNVAGFRGKMLHTTPQRIKAIQEAANEQEFRPLQDMAIEDPSQRATAGDMLDKLFAGEGRTTPHNRTRATAIGAENAEPGAPEQRIEHGDATTGKKRSRERKTARRSPREAVAAAKGRRPRPPNPGTEKRLPGPAVQTPARGTPDVPRLPGAFPVSQGRRGERPYFT